MSDISKKSILNEFKPYFRIINAFNPEHFHGRDWRALLFSGFFAFCLVLFVCLVPIYIILGSWYLLENESDLVEIAVTVPILATLLQMELTFVALIMENHTIIETMDRLQRVIDQRKLCTLFALMNCKRQKKTHYFTRISQPCFPY